MDIEKIHRINSSDSMNIPDRVESRQPARQKRQPKKDFGKILHDKEEEALEREKKREGNK